jgi:very-short-patch-repair endonuclease
MSTITSVLLMVAIAAVLLLALKIEKKPAGETWPFYERRVMSKPEQVLYFRLVEVLPECIVLAQVQLSRVLGVKKGHNFRQWLNRIDRKSLDFLICLKDCSVVAAIELDDSTHDRDDRKKADRDKERALASAGVKLIRWQARSLPDVETIREAFKN